MKASRIVLIAFATNMMAGAALADPPTGSRLGDHRRPGPTLTARDQAEGAKRMAECLYNRKTELARQALLASTKLSADAATNKLMGNVQCFGAEFSNDMVEERRVDFPTDILRGMLAEAGLDRARDQVRSFNLSLCSRFTSATGTPSQVAMSASMRWAPAWRTRTLQACWRSLARSRPALTKMRRSVA
jgi:hypothetical protein